MFIYVICWRRLKLLLAYVKQSSRRCLFRELCSENFFSLHSKHSSSIYLHSWRPFKHLCSFSPSCWPPGQLTTSAIEQGQCPCSYNIDPDCFWNIMAALCILVFRGRMDLVGHDFTVLRSHAWLNIHFLKDGCNILSAFTLYCTIIQQLGR